MISSDFWDTKLFAAIIGAASATVIFALSRAIEHYKEERQRLRSEIAVLLIVSNEAGFYLERLKQLSSELKLIISGCDAIANGGQLRPFTVPSYSLYPDVIGQSQLDVAREIENADLVRQVSLVRFELSHISERMKDLKERFAQGLSQGAISSPRQMRKDF